MEEEVIKGIIDDLTNSLKDNGKFIKLPYNDYESIEISKENFKEIKNLDIKNKIAFIDGGNAEILKSSNFSLQFIRVYHTIYKDNKRFENKKYEFYLLIKSINKEDKIFYKTAIFGDQIIDNLEFDSFDKTITQGNSRGDISFVGNIARRFSELNIAKELINKLEKDDVVVLDGNLETKYTNEEEIMKNIYEEALKKEIIITALSKTCELFTDKGTSIIDALRDIQPDKEWYYYPIAKIRNQNQDMLFTKLNEKSKYVFRFDIFNKQIDKINNILSLLKQNSKDPVFVGYPYGLIEADRFARISNKELELLKTRFMVKAGKNWKNINNSLKTKDSHNILDNIG